MENVLHRVLERLAKEVASDFCSRGGSITDGERDIPVEDVGSFNGALTPILWMAVEFFEDIQLQFPGVVYKAEVDSMTGFVLDRLTIEGSVSPVVFLFSDFLRNELFGGYTNKVDLSTLLTNFRSWGLEHLAPDASPTVPAASPVGE